jgi:hypothetical protein
MKILRANARRVVRQGPFQIRRMRPSLVLGPKADPAFDDVCAHAALLETAIADFATPTRRTCSQACHANSTTAFGHWTPTRMSMTA